VGLTESLVGRRVYFDTNIFIYLVEGFAGHRETLEEIRSALRSGRCEAVTGELTLCEVLVAPFRAGDDQRSQVYRGLIERSGAFELQPTTRAIYVRASQLRAAMGLRTADAIHVATAMECACDAFLTNDAGLRTPKELHRILFSEPH
jgi:predicted nucleic acid-binding protein